MSGLAERPQPRASEVLVDVVAVLVLGLLAVSGLQGSYAGVGWLVVAAVALGVTTCWALVCVAQGWATSVYLLVLVLLYPLVGGWAVYHDLSLAGLPSATTLGETVTGTLTGPARLLTTIAPADARGDVLTIPFALGWVAGSASCALALHTRRPLLPAVPFLVVTAVVALVGTSDPTGLLLRGAATAVAVALWVVLREGRSAPASSRRGGAVRVVGAVVLVLVVGAAVAVVAPQGSATERVVLRGRVGSGQDVSQLDNPLAAFRNFTRQPAGAVDNLATSRLLVVRGLPTGQRLRWVALDEYDGSTWNAGNRTVAGDSGSLFQRIATEVGARRTGEPVQVGVEVRKAWSSSWLPLAGELTGIDFDYLDGRAQRDDVRYNLATQTAMVVGGLAEGDDYTFTAVLPDDRLPRSATAFGDGRPLQPAGAFLDADLRPWRESGLAPVRQVLSLARYLRTNGRYSDGATEAERRYLPGHGQVRLGQGFIGAPAIVGDDEQYAAFMALAANRLGVPARVVVGAQVERDGTVRGRDVGAWVELRVADGSWRRLPTSAFMSHRPPRRSDVRQTPASYVQTTVPRETRDDDPPAQLPDAQRPPLPPTAPQDARDLRWVPLPLALLLLLAPPLVKLVRRRWRRRGGPAEQLAAAWQDLLDEAVDQGRPVRPGLARTEQARRLGVPADLAMRLDVAVFAPRDPDAATVRALVAGVDGERRRLAGSLPLARRVAAQWQLRSLLPRRQARRSATSARSAASSS